MQQEKVSNNAAKYLLSFINNFKVLSITYLKGDPIEFLSWLLNSLHLTLNGTKNPNSSIIYKTFQGHMRVYTKKIPPVDLVNI